MSVGGQGNSRDGFLTQLLMIPQEIHLLRDQNTHHRFPAAHPLAISDATAQRKTPVEHRLQATKTQGHEERDEKK